MNLEARRIGLQIARDVGINEPSSLKLEMFVKKVAAECLATVAEMEHDIGDEWEVAIRKLEIKFDIERE